MKNWTVVKRVTVLVAALVLVILLLAAAIHVRLRSIQSEASSIQETTIPALGYLDSVQRIATENNAIVFRYIYSPSPEDRKQLEAVMAANTKENEEVLKGYATLNLSAAERTLFNETSVDRDKMRTVRAEILAASRAATTPQQLAVVNARARGEYDSLVRTYILHARRLMELQREASEETSAKMTASVHGADLWALSAGFAAFVVSIGFGSYVIRGINAILRMTVDALTLGSDEIVSAAGQVSSASQGLASGASEQAASLEETGASMEELTCMTKQNASGAGEAKEIAAAARASVEANTHSVQRLNAAMEDLKTSSAEVSKIIKTIDEIAFQTNILALNAAVEAARAGESGAGFAVVADEVRNLAQRSALAAKETEGKIAAAMAKSDEGFRISGEVSASLAGMAGQVRKLDDHLSKIVKASQEQVQGIDHINTAVRKIDEVTQSTAATAEESASASEELNAQAIELKRLVAGLLLLVGGRRKSDPKGIAGAPKPGGRRRIDPRVQAPEPALF